MAEAEGNWGESVYWENQGQLSSPLQFRAWVKKHEGVEEAGQTTSFKTVMIRLSQGLRFKVVA